MNLKILNENLPNCDKYHKQMIECDLELNHKKVKALRRLINKSKHKLAKNCLFFIDEHELDILDISIWRVKPLIFRKQFKLG